MTFDLYMCTKMCVLHGVHVLLQNNKRNVKLFFFFFLKDSSRARSDGHTLAISALGRQRQEDSYECKTSLTCCSSSRIARAIFQDFVSKKLKKGKQKGWRKDNGARHGGFPSVTLALRGRGPA